MKKSQITKWDPFGELTKWEPFGELNRELGDFRNRMMSLLHRGNGGEWRAIEEGSEFADWLPAVDVSEDDNEYLIKADLPEVSKDQVKVSMDDGRLTIQGERKHEEETKKKKYHRIERSYGRYTRSFRIPEDVEPDKIDAQFKAGVLTVHLPKSEAKKHKEKEIAVHG